MVVGAIPPLPPVSSTPATAPAATPASTPVGGDSFSSVITNALESLQKTQTSAANAEALSAAGQGNLADTMIAASKASLDTQVTTSLLNKAVTSYNDIMNMSF